MCIKLCLEFYPSAIIEKAVEDYSSIAEIKVIDKSKEYWICKIFFCEKDKEIVKNEFLNYLVCLCNLNEVV